ncbi:MAG: hypothetical protein ACR2MD_18995, partial [Aridibacter sp.]
MTMLNNVESSDIGIHFDYAVYKRPSVSEAKTNNDNDFIGYLPIQRKEEFTSDKPKIHFWKANHLYDEFIEGEGLSRLTKQFRLDFRLYIKSSYAFRYLQMRPVQIPFTDTLGKERTYEPLALLKRDNIRGVPARPLFYLIDVWSDADINRHKSILHPAFRIANRFALE